MLTRTVRSGFLLAAVMASLAAQDSNYGIGVPITVTGGAMHTERLQLRNPNAASTAAGLRAVLYPTIKLGSHWFGYAALQIRSTPYFYYDAFTEPTFASQTDVLQGFVGYATHYGPASIVFKAGHLASAFGAFAIRYDDADNPLLDQPLGYITELPLRGDQLVCGTSDLQRQSYGSVSNSCGGVVGRGHGLTPVTLYGLPGVQAEVSVGAFDARAQLTSGSTANTRGWSVAGPYRQWSVGGGYTVGHSFRIGAAGFSGPYLNTSLARLLPEHKTIRDYPASGFGVDARWARGRWNLSGEWQRFQFSSPGFVDPPSVTTWYVESKARLSARWFVAGRAGKLTPGGVLDTTGMAARRFAGELGSYEVGAGYWLNRHQLIKASYDWLKATGVSGTRFNVYGVQLVTSFHGLQKAFR